MSWQVKKWRSRKMNIDRDNKKSRRFKIMKKMISIIKKKKEDWRKKIEERKEKKCDKKELNRFFFFSFFSFFLFFNLFFSLSIIEIFSSFHFCFLWSKLHVLRFKFQNLLSIHFSFDQYRFHEVINCLLVKRNLTRIAIA